MSPAEYMGFLVRNGTDEDTPLLGLQGATRVPQISEINADKEGVAIKVRVDSVVPWVTTGLGQLPIGSHN